MTEIWHDIRSAARMLVKNPACTVTAFLTLAIVVGANTAVFSVVYGVLLKPLPYPESEQLAFIWNGVEQSRSDVMNVDSFDYFRQTNRSFEAVSPFAQTNLTVDTDGTSNDVAVVRVSSNFFSAVLRVNPALGRNFSSSDERPDAPPAALISHEFWRSEFGSDQNVVGRIIRARNYPVLEVIGVLPADFRSPADLAAPAPIWTLGGSGPSMPPAIRFRVFGRLKKDVTLEQTQAELDALSGQITGRARTAIQADVVVTAAAPPLQVMALGGSYARSDRVAILIFFGAVLCVLLIGIVNLVGLEMSQLPKFEGELSIRAAMGATRWRLVRLMLTKTVLVGMTGGILGTMLAALTNDVLLSSMPLGFPRKLDISIDVNVWLFSIGLSILSSLLIASLPAFSASRHDVREVLSASGRFYTGDRRYRILQDALTALETGLAVVLVVGAGLLIHSFWRLVSVDMGFDFRDVAAIRVRLPESYQGAAYSNLFHDALDRIQTVPDVESAAISDSLPMFAIRGTRVSTIEGTVPREVRSNLNAVSNSFFEALRIPIVSGRAFTRSETRDGVAVAMLSESLARDLFPAGTPIGKQIQWINGANTPVLTVVGITSDIQMNSPLTKSKQPMMYVTPQSGARAGPLGRFVIVRTEGDVRTVDQIIKTLEPNAITQIDRMEDRFSVSTARHRFQTGILGGFAMIALLLASLGVYTVLSYSVARRTRELGVRMALGAQRIQLFTSVFRRAIVPATVGVILGLAVSYTFRRVLTAYLFEIQPNDAATYVVVTLVLTVVILAACAIPAVRAARLDPISALRYE